MSIKASYLGVRKYMIKAICESPLHIGSAIGEKGDVLVHPADQIPFIQATAMAGVCSNYIEKNWDVETKNKWFGHDSRRENRGTKSRITFGDGIFSKETLVMEFRPRIKLDGETGTVQSTELKGNYIQSGQITNVELISAGAEFQFTIYQFIDDEKDDKVVEWCLGALNQGDILLGGQVSTGCGVVKLKSVKNVNYDLCKTEDLKAWMKEEDNEEKCAKEIIDKVVQLKEIKQSYYKIAIHTEYKNSILIKGNSLDSNSIAEITHCKDIENTSAVNIMNGKKEFIIPGSSFKGALRSRMESITKYWNWDNDLLKNVFSNGVKIYFYDSILKETDTARLISRNAINKMTGGAKNQALFFEVSIGGKTEQIIKINKKKTTMWTEEDIKSIIGLILYALRDFAIGAASMGGGASIGRGFMDISKIELFDGTDLLITMNPKENKMVDEGDFLKSCLGVLTKRRDSNDKKNSRQ